MSKEKIRKALSKIDAKIYATSHKNPVYDNDQREVEEALQTLCDETDAESSIRRRIEGLADEIQLSGYLSRPSLNPGSSRTGILEAIKVIRQLNSN